MDCGQCGGSVGAAGATFGAAVQYFAAAQCLLGEKWPPRATLKNETRVDVIIVGGGTAGAALAARLSQVLLTVLLLEAGPEPPTETIVPGFQVSLPHSIYDYNYTTTDDHYASQSLLHKRQRLTIGRMLGGSGSLNAMIYSRGFPADYDEWAHILNDHTWNYTNVLSYFKKSENLTDKVVLNSPGAKYYHGTEGEIEVAGLDELSSDAIKFVDAFSELGFNVVEDRNNPEEIGVGHLYMTIKNGKRQSSLTAMLNKAGSRGNLFVMSEAVVKKVLIENNTAYGVQVFVNDQELVFYAEKEVIVSAGTYNTPKLLMLSGIGPAEHLQSQNIEMVLNLPVGDNLHDHVTVVSFIAAESGTCDKKNEAEKQFDVIKYLYNGTGSLSIASRVGVDYALKNSQDGNVPDFSVFPSCEPINSNFYKLCRSSLDFTDDICSNLDSLNKYYDLLMLKVVLLKPKSRGTVRLRSRDIFDAPVIYAGTFSNPEDLQGYPEVLDVVWSLANTSYFKSKNAFVLGLGVEKCVRLKWPENVKCMARGIAMKNCHGVGTAAMGSVVDSRLKVLGVKNLRVVDASVMPKVPRGNTNTPVIMIADKAADFIKYDHGYCAGETNIDE